MHLWRNCFPKRQSIGAQVNGVTPLFSHNFAVRFDLITNVRSWQKFGKYSLHHVPCVAGWWQKARKRGGTRLLHARTNDCGFYNLNYLSLLVPTFNGNLNIIEEMRTTIHVAASITKVTEIVFNYSAINLQAIW